MTRFLQFMKNNILNFIYGKQGLPRAVNGHLFRIIPEKRWYFSPEYDRPVASYFAKRISPGDLCVSIGANMGIYPLMFSGWNKPDGLVIAVEPNPESCELLDRHVRLNKLENRVKIIRKAISSKPGRATFHASKADGMSRLGMPNPLLDGKTHEIEVEVINLDSLFLGVSSPVGALMMDIEGFEIAALQGGLHFLKSHLAKAIVIEMHPNAWDMAGTTRADFEQILIDCGLKAVSLSGQIDALAEYGHIGLEPV